MITYYNKNKSGVDVFDKIRAAYNVARNTRHWPMVVCFALLNEAGINSQVIWIDNGLENMQRCLFLRQLGYELVKPQLQRRSLQTQGMPAALTEDLKKFRPFAEYGEESGPETAEECAPPTKRRSCALCYTSRKTRLIKCIWRNCKRSICGEHTTTVCIECYPKLQEKEDDLSN